MNARSRIELFGGLRVQQGNRLITRFRSQKTGALLAYLAYYRHRAHSREALIELLWPECDVDVGRSRLSIALSSLRHQLEPPGVAAGTILLADRASLRLNPDAFTTDIAEFESALRSAERARGSAEREHYLGLAMDRYRGPLLPDFDEDWIPAEQERLAELYLQALRTLLAQAEAVGELLRALDYAHRAVATDPLREESHQDLMRLYAAVGQPSATQKQYRELERILQDEIGVVPSVATRDLLRAIQSRAEEAASEDRHVDARTPGPGRRDAGRAAGKLPTGTVTFLWTDIEEATALQQRAGAAFEAARISHHALLRRAFSRHGGHEVKETGDGFLVAFQSAADAMTSAVAGQRSMSAHPWPPEVGALRVRMALHTGDVEIRQGEYHGPAPCHASRIVVAAHGGQILCSEVTAGVLGRDGSSAMAPPVVLSDLGFYRLQDQERGERLFQVDYPEVPHRQFPPLKAQAGQASSLPLQLTRFFGREPELARLREVLLAGETRLVTLTGPGGSGKTRLAVEGAAPIAEALRGAVWFVPLASLSDSRRIPDALRDALRLPGSPHMSPLDQAVDALSRQPALLVLDNFEHLLDGEALLVRSLLERVPGLKCLVTSRRRLSLEGEREIRVHPLPTPPGAATPERLALNESVQLFVDRAQAVRPDFQVTNSNAAAVAELCQRLEGIPLAVELAAARAQVLTPAQMLEQLEHRLDFLRNRRRDAIARHRTLRAAIEWGCQLLTPELQRFFAQLSVFQGGWSLQAAEAVTEHPLALDALAQLQECSLILVEEHPPEMRFRMLETLREYAAEQVKGEERAALERRHADYYLCLAEEAEARVAVEERKWLDRLERELDNLRQALAWGLDREPEFAVRLAGALDPLWRFRGYWSEARETLARVLERAPPASAELRAKALCTAGFCAREQGDYPQAKKLLAESLALSRPRGDGKSIAHALSSLQRIAWIQGDLATARTLCEEGLSISRETGDPNEVADALCDLANVIGMQGDRDKSRSLYEESLRLCQQTGSQRRIAFALHCLGLSSSHRRDYAAARALFEEEIAILQSLGDRVTLVAPFIHLAHVARAEGAPEEAHTLLIQSLRICRRLGNQRLAAECLVGLAVDAASQGRPERAVRLFGAASAVNESLRRPPVLRGGEQRAALQAALGEAGFAAAWETGRALTWQQAADEALAE